jgi:hypothetical protein
MNYRAFELVADRAASDTALHRLASAVRRSNITSQYPNLTEETWEAFAYGRPPVASGTAAAHSAVAGKVDVRPLSAAAKSGSSQPISKSMRGWWRKYTRSMVCVLIGYLALVVLPRVFRQPVSLVEATTAYFLVVNLFVLWWYADTTRAQADVGLTQSRTSQEQYALSLQLREESAMPIVIVERQFVPASESTGPADVRYAARNIGPGVAVNSFAVVERESKGKELGAPTFWSVGGLGTADQRVLPSEVERSLRDGKVRAVAIVAEGVARRGTRWVVTVNGLSDQGDVVHRLLAGDDSAAEFSLPQLVDAAWPRIGVELRVVREDARLSR